MKRERSLISLSIISLIGISFLLISLPLPSAGAEGIDVDEILEAAAVYCERLESAVLYFVCREEIIEKIDFSKDITLIYQARRPERSWVRTKVPRRRVKNTYVYDFQFIRRNNQIQEIRTLLEENGEKKSEEDASLKTQRFIFKNVVLGPVGILGKRWQPYHDYKIIGEDEVNGLPAVILNAVPKPSHNVDFLFGKVWIDKKNFDILRVEWSPQRIGNFATFERRGLKYKSEPSITLISEFLIEKNGIRFPNYFLIEEAYIDKKGKKFIRSETEVTYKEFKFFTVEIEVKH
jgi:hypothetical protein